MKNELHMFNPKFAKTNMINRPESKSTKNDCVVRALAACMNIEYDAAYIKAKECGRIDGDGMYNDQVFRLMSMNGFNIVGYFGAVGEEVKRFYSPTEGKHYTGCTLKKFCQYFPRGRFYVSVKGHAVAIIDGEIIGNPYENINQRIKYVFEFQGN